jgi:hypothetical protein
MLTNFWHFGRATVSKFELPRSMIASKDGMILVAKGMISVAILSLDHLTFANNHCWLDGPLTAAMDAFLLSGSLHVTANRFQEAAGSVLISGVTFGLSNITTENISTYCLLADGVAAFTIKTPNVVFSTTLCPDLGK